MTTLSSCLDSNFGVLCQGNLQRPFPEEYLNYKVPNADKHTSRSEPSSELRGPRLLYWDCIAEAGKTKRGYFRILQEFYRCIQRAPRFQRIEIYGKGKIDGKSVCACMRVCALVWLSVLLAKVGWPWVSWSKYFELLNAWLWNVSDCIEDAGQSVVTCTHRHGWRMFVGKKLSTRHQLWQDLRAPLEHHEHLFYVQKTTQNVPKEACAVDPLRLSKHSPRISRSAGNSRFSADFGHTFPTPSSACRLYLAYMKTQCLGNHAVSSSGVTEGVGCWMKLRWTEAQESEEVCPWLGHSWKAMAFIRKKKKKNLRFLFENLF